MKKSLCICLFAATAAPLLAGDVAERQLVDQLTASGLLQPSQIINVDVSERTTCVSGMITAGTTIEITFVLPADCCNWEINSCLSDETDTRFNSLIGPGINLQGVDDPGVCPRDCAGFNPDVLSPSYGYDLNNGYALPPACLPAGAYVLTMYSFGSYNPGDCSYVDPGPFTVCINDCNGGGQVGADEQPAAFELGQNVPNPFNPTTSISFSLPESGVASLTLHDISGREVATLVNGMTERGAHSVNFDASQLGTGVYFYTLQFNGQSTTRKMTLIK